MKRNLCSAVAVASLVILASSGLFAVEAPPSAAATSTTARPYKVINSAKVGGDGAFDYVYADSSTRRLYIPRGNRVTIFDLDTLKPAGEIPECIGARGVAVDPEAHHGFSSSKPVVMWDSVTLQTIKKIDVEGKPDGMFFHAPTHHVFVFSHEAPNATVIESSDGSIVGTIDLGGQPEQAVSDDQGHIYVNLEDKASLAVIDAKTLKVTGRYEFGEIAKTPTGLALDVKNRILFSCCRNPAVCVILKADDGKIISHLPIGAGCDGAVFNPATKETFTSQRDGTLTVIKEFDPSRFEVVQNVQTKAGAKTLTLDPKTNKIYSITADRLPPPPAAPGETAPRPGRGQIIPDTFTILVVGAE